VTETQTTWVGIAVLAFVTVQRLVELRLSYVNTRRLLARGAVEHGRGHYAFIVGLHMVWLAALWWWAPGRPIRWWLVAAFAILQLGRIWVIASLRGRWTTRIIVPPDEPLVTRGPYRFVRHPNYWIVALEIAVLPLVFGLWQIAIVFTLLNALLLAIRIRAENSALRGPSHR
jgi:methyltransferase